VAITLSSTVGKVSDVRIPKLANAVSASETQPTLEAVASQHMEEASNRALASNREREALKRINTRDPKIAARPEKRYRRVKGKGKGKGKGKVAEGLQGDTENVPPTTIRQNANTRRRRARSTGRVELGNGPPPKRGRGTNKMVNAFSTGQARSMSVIGEKSEVTRRLPSLGVIGMHGRESVQDAVPLPLKNLALPNADGFHHANTADADGNYCRSVSAPLSTVTDENENIGTSSSPCEEKGLPNPTAEGDVSSVQPLPSSTRRRAKEYFQRRTRERSVDAAGRHTRPPRRVQSATVTEQSILSNVLVPRSQLDLNEAKASGRPSGTGWSASSSDEMPDRFVFDPVASPFTPNATSSPRQASPSYIAVQSFSSPTPLPSHGNRKVASLILPKSSNRSTRFEARGDSVPQLAPVTSHGIPSTRRLAYTYTLPGADQAQAHLQAEQMALVRLQAYYNWLAGSTPITGVSMGVSAYEHMDMSGGGGGLSGGVALGRQSQNQGRGKGQCRNTSGAYAHPKEHVVFSPGDHEQTDVASQSVLQQGCIQTGLVKPGKDGAKEPEGVAQRTVQKWDGKWGLREAAASGREIGWNWGNVGANVRAS
jgi:hypothetical protein